jgi:DNA mismatch repair protein MutS2
MNPQSLELLEYEALRTLLGGFVASDLGRVELAAMQPSTDRAWLAATLADTTEALEYSREATRSAKAEAPSRLRFEGIPNPAAPAAKLRIEGAVLDGLEIAALAGLMERASEIRNGLAAHGGRFPRLASQAAALADFRGVLRDLSGKLNPDGSVSDSASVALARIRRDMERQRNQIQESLERFLRSHRDDGVLQEEFVTLRNDRFVVPVIPGAKKRIPGVIHGTSGSGHTLFVEPLETIELNNDLVRLSEEELREVHRILREMTAKLRDHAGDLRSAIQILGRLDFVFAKARFAMDFDAIVPRFSPENEPRMLLRGARHPLLEAVLKRQRKRVVPISLELNATRRTLLISGPNTGGKTVAMKTAGLLALMAQSGLPVPAEEAEFPVFEEVLADIGDQQSIEQSLSTFSAHVARIRAMVEAVTPDTSLVLLDELGRATDPEEGGALGVAILEEFREFRAFTLASTHLLAIKVYGSNTPGVLNASMGFDEATLEPTFQLRTGAPGKSAGLDIASRLGLPEHLIQRARAALSSTERDLQLMLTSLEQQLGEAAAKSEQLEQRKEELELREAERMRALDRKENERLKQFERSAAEAMEQFEARAQETIERVLCGAEQRKAAERALRQVAQTKRGLREEMEAMKSPGGEPKKLLAVTEGARVRLRDVSSPSRVLKVLPDDMLEVEVGLLKMQVRRSDVLEVLPAVAAGVKLPKGVTFTGGPRWDALTREINVIGKTAEEASEIVDKFLDSAVLAEVTHIRIVHGHGHGILRKMVQELLARHPQVEKHYPASPQEGGTGATIVELKGG